jgi:hypothetical protein
MKYETPPSDETIDDMTAELLNMADDGSLIAHLYFDGEHLSVHREPKGPMSVKLTVLSFDVAEGLRPRVEAALVRLGTMVQEETFTRTL